MCFINHCRVLYTFCDLCRCNGVCWTSWMNNNGGDCFFLVWMSYLTFIKMRFSILAYWQNITCLKWNNEIFPATLNFKDYHISKSKIKYPIALIFNGVTGSTNNHVVVKFLFEHTKDIRCNKQTLYSNVIQYYVD